jgi:carboxyl-terminal processing protease
LLQEQLVQLSAKAVGGLRGLILDLRRNPGGLLDQGVKVADRFIADGLIVKTAGKGGRVMDESHAHSRGTWLGFPMVVLVDGATASAAEIVAGALQDHGRAAVLGTQTFGKGSVQTVMELDGCGPKPCGLKITVARYYTPSGRSIQGKGIAPSMVVEPTPPPAVEPAAGSGPRQRLDDHQLQAALDYLQSPAALPKKNAGG